MQLRYYQEDAINSIFNYFIEKTGDPIVGAPTGTGKSVIIAGFLERVFKFYPNQNIMVLTHVKELIQQNYNKLIDLWPTAPCGIYSSGLQRKDLGRNITFAGIGSVRKKPELFGHVDLIIIDECHLLSNNKCTMYQKFIEDLREINPHLKVIGLTATPYRMGLGLLTEGNLFTDFCYDITGMADFNRLIDEGFLAPLIPKRTKLQLDTSNVPIQGGDFVLSKLQEAIDVEEITEAALKETIELSEGRKHWLVFAAGIDHTINTCNMLNDLGIKATCIHSKMSDKERDKNIALYKTGYYQAMVNNGILTTGFDFPQLDLIVMLRPTESTGLWVQMLGRGTRPYPGKENCLVLDFAGNTAKLGPINDPVIPKKRRKKGNGSAPIKLCEACGTYNHASVRVCINCGHTFPKGQLCINSTASNQELIAKATLPIIEIFKVLCVSYRVNKKAGRPDTIMVTYTCGSRMFREFVCLEHGGYPATKARDWWIKASLVINEEPPETTKEALDRIKILNQPINIKVWINKKPYPEVRDHDYSGTAFREDRKTA